MCTLDVFTRQHSFTKIGCECFFQMYNGQVFEVLVKCQCCWVHSVPCFASFYLIGSLWVGYCSWKLNPRGNCYPTDTMGPACMPSYPQMHIPGYLKLLAPSSLLLAKFLFTVTLIHFVRLVWWWLWEWEILFLTFLLAGGSLHSIQGGGRGA